MTPIPTNKGLLIPVVVSVDATKIDIHPAGSNPTPHPAALWWSVNNTSQMKYITDGENHSLIGTLMYKDGQHIFDFDPEPFVQHMMPESVEEIGLWTILNPETHFISLLQSYSVGWVNPLGEEPKEIGFKDSFLDTEAKEAILNEWKKRVIAWQEAESRKLSVDQMVVLIQVK